MWRRSDMYGEVRLWMDLNLYSRIFKSLWNWTGRQWSCGGTDMMWWTERILVITRATKFGSLWRNDWVRLKRRLLQWSRGEGTRPWPRMAAAWERGRGGLKRLMLHRWRYAERGCCWCGTGMKGRRVLTEEEFEKFFTVLFEKISGKQARSFFLEAVGERSRRNWVCWWVPLRIGNGCCIYVKNYQEELTLLEWLKRSTAQKACICDKWNIN